MPGIFDSCKLQINGIPFPVGKEVQSLLKQGAIFVDLREDIETMIKAFGIENIIYLPHSKLEEKWTDLPADKPLILADSVGIWSKSAAGFLKEKGYTRVASLAGGIAEWERDGLPLKADRYQPLNGPCLCMIRPKEKK